MIPSQRKVKASLLVGRADGFTWEDVTDYVAKVEVELGDVSSVGTGDAGVDGRIRRLDFELRNETGRSFSPRDRNSPWNQFGGNYSPLIWPNREVLLRAPAGLPLNRYLGIADGVRSAWPVGINVKADDIVDVSVGQSYKWSDLAGKTWANSGLKWNTPKATIPQTDGITVDPATDSVVFAEAPAKGAIILASIALQVTLFHGCLGDNIRTNGRTVSCSCRDLAKRLQDCYIETVRTYGSEAGTPAETVIQQIMNDNLGVNAPALHYPAPSGFMVKPYELEYKTVWDAIQEIAAQIGWFLGYRWDPDSGEYRLTFMDPPREKDASTADFVLDYTDDFYAEDLDINDTEVRNAVKVSYRDAATGERKTLDPDDPTYSPWLKDQLSIDEYGRRAMQIEEADTSLIDSEAEALAFGNKALRDLKDLTATTRIEMPFLPEMDVFAGIVVHDPRLSSTDDFYGVQSVRHTLQWPDGDEGKATFRTEVIACGRVIGAHQRWLQMQTRPGANQPSTPANMATNVRPPQPQGLAVTSAIRGLVVYLNKPQYLNWDGFEIHVGESETFTPDDSTLKAKGRATRFEIVDLTPTEIYWVRAVAYNTSGIRSIPTDPISQVAGQVQESDLAVHSITAGIYKELRNTLPYVWADSLDADHPFVCDFYIPAELTSIVSIKLSAKGLKYRAYSNAIGVSDIFGTKTTRDGDHEHELFGGWNSSGYTESAGSDYHSHRYSIPAIPTTAKFGGAHDHSVDLSHGHGLRFGIYEGTLPSNVKVYCDNGAGYDAGTALTLTGDGTLCSELDLTAKFSGPGWKKLKFTSSSLGRIAAVLIAKIDLDA